MVVITNHHVFGLASLLPMVVAAVLLWMIRAARRMVLRTGPEAAVHVPPPWRGAMVADGTAACMGKRCQRTTQIYLSRVNTRHINLGHHPTLYG